MFERYTETAERVIFAAVYIARRVGSPTIETEHLLLGLLREDRAIPRFTVGCGNSLEKDREDQNRPRKGSRFL
jgi:ATP-dependent Clp protease ATP-binding subunit ClpC